jgi:serine/threonine protein kinase
MSLPSHTKLGPYEILAPHDAGGMGEVYRARDTRLDRVVAIKILPGSFPPMLCTSSGLSAKRKSSPV